MIERAKHDFAGVEFSPNSKVLYVITYDNDNLFQYDLRSNNVYDIIASKLNVFIPTSRDDEDMSEMQLASNGKIYLFNISNVSSI